jgi:putative pyruvate formate lyase activating enzyme
VRHLVLPESAAGTADVVHFLSQEVSKNTYLNIMDQYRPEYRAGRFPGLARRITLKEYSDAVDLAVRTGLVRGLEIR